MQFIQGHIFVSVVIDEKKKSIDMMEMKLFMRKKKRKREKKTEKLVGLLFCGF